MTQPHDCDICVIGAGAGGLSVAAGGALMGAKVVLIERGEMGGDCLNAGCVPSKALLAAAHAAHRARRAARFGVRAADPTIDGAEVMAHVRRSIARLAPMDSRARFEGLGVRVIHGAARFTGPTTVAVGATIIRPRRVVIATGSAPAVPNLPGLDGVPFLTNQTLFQIETLPEHMAILGGGPMGLEMAQALCRLGRKATVIEAAHLLPREDPEAVDLLRAILRREGVRIVEGAVPRSVRKTTEGVAVTWDGGEIAASHLLVAAGRRPDLGDLDPAAAGIAHTERGITVDGRLRTSNSKVYAVGDVTGQGGQTHIAAHHASVILRNILLRLPAKVDGRAVPRAIYTDPELAQVGLTEAEAKTACGKINVLRWPFADNDRACIEDETEGLVKVMLTPRGRILGATVLGARAGELIQPWILALGKKLGVGAVAGMIAPYPTRGEASKRAAASFFAPKIFGPSMRRWVRFLGRFG